MIIETSQIRKSFGELEVLKGIDFSAQKAEIVAIVGASGAGKTTFLQVLGTLLTPDSGSMTIDGIDAFAMKGDAQAAFRGKKIGFVFQQHRLLPEFTAEENVMIPALIAGASKKEARQKALELLGMVGLSQRANHKPSELSGGEAQRVAIARALVNSPAVLLADEPTGSLDSATKQEINSLLLSLREKLGQTIIIVTHDPELAAICDRKVVMKDGRILSEE